MVKMTEPNIFITIYCIDFVLQFTSGDIKLYIAHLQNYAEGILVILGLCQQSVNDLCGPQLDASDG